MQSPPFPRYLVLPRSKYSNQIVNNNSIPNCFNFGIPVFIAADKMSGKSLLKVVSCSTLLYNHSYKEF